MLDLDAFDAITFDCYGTLVDWESGILTALRPLVARAGTRVADEELLAAFAVHESRAEAGEYVSYREVLASVLRGLASEVGFGIEPSDEGTLARSLPEWPLFPDTVEALGALAGRYRLGVLSNIDDDLFAATRRRLGVRFDWVVTAQQLGCYKPSPACFEALIGRVGLDPARILHAAQSPFHDIAPASRIGLSTVWVRRRGGRGGSGATPPAVATPDLEVPDLAALVRHAGLDDPRRR